MTDVVHSNILAVVVDVSPLELENLESEDLKTLTVNQFFEAAVAFCNLYIASSPTNELLVYLASPSKCEKVYPRAKRAKETKEVDQFSLLSDLLKQAQSNVIKPNGDCQNGTVDSPNTLLTGALASALCCINKFKKTRSGNEVVHSRCLVIKASDDDSTQHTNLMNIFFAAQKHNVTLDCCTCKRSCFMEQACDITGGLYYTVEDLSGFLEYLLCLFLPDPSVRESLALPPKGDVELGPACFCHKKLISIGWVCSVCLSVFCQFSPICSTCQTAFKLMPNLGMKAKKKKKTAV